MTNETRVGQYLEPFGLQLYAAQFVEHGYDQPLDIFTLDDQDLDILIPDEAEKSKYKSALQEDPNLVHHWLDSLGLTQYYPHFQAAGFISMAQCSRITLQSLDNMNVHLPGHRKRLIREATINRRDPRDGSNKEPAGSISREVKFMVDSGSDTVTIHDDIIRELQLPVIGSVTQQVPGGISRKIPLYSASLVIGKKKLSVEVVPDKVNTLGTPVLWEFRHLIDDKKHVWFAKTAEEAASV